MESILSWIMDKKKFISVVSFITLLLSVLLIIISLNNTKTEKITYEERSEALEEFYNYCEDLYCQNETLVGIHKMARQSQELLSFATKSVLKDPRISIGESILLEIGDYEVKKHYKKYSLLIDSGEVKKIELGANTKLNVSIQYDGKVLKLDPYNQFSFMYTLDNDVAFYNNSNNELLTYNKGKTSLVLVDGLYRTEFEIIVK